MELDKFYIFRVKPTLSCSEIQRSKTFINYSCSRGFFLNKIMRDTIEKC